MTTEQIAHRLIELCRKGEWEQAQKELYHQDIVSIEPEATGGKVSKGLDAIFEKNKMWAGMAEEVHSWSISDPLIADGFFACTMTNDVTLKGHGRMQSTEICIYEVKNGKIVKEQFFHQ